MASDRWNTEINQFLQKIERETEQSIQKLKKSLNRCGLSFDQKFRRFFLRATDNRLNETFDRFEIETFEQNHLQQQRQHNRQYHLSRTIDDNRRRQYSRDRDRRSISHCQQHSQSHSRSFTAREQVNGRERSPLRHQERRSHSAQFQGGQNVRKTSVKDRLGTPVKKPLPVVHNSSPKPSTSQQHHQNERNYNTNTADEMDQIDGNAESEEMIDMSDLVSILNKCISEPRKTPSSLTDLMFCCVYCQNNDDFPNAKSMDIEDIFGHWLSGHTFDLPHVQPFAFAVLDMNTACFYCNKIATLQQMLKHLKECHRNRSIAIVNPSNRNECAFCSYSDSTWLDHFQLNHKMLLENDVVNPILLTDELLSQLLAIDVHKVRKCSVCMETFQTQHQFEHHSIHEHPEQPENISQIVDTPAEMYLICDVCQEHIAPDVFLNHLEFEHTYEFTCTKCDFSTDDLVNMAFHENQTHQCDSLKFHCLQFSDRLQRHYFHTRAVFGNGLTLTKHNLLNTSYNDYKEFRYMVETIVDIKVKKFNWLMRAHRRRHSEDGFELMSQTDKANGSDDDDDDDDSVSTNELLLSIASSHGQVSPPTTPQVPLKSVRKARHPKSPINYRNPNYLKELKKQLRLLKNICIHGIPRRENENLREIVLRVFEKIGARISSNDISLVHRISKSDPLIIVKFMKISAKQRVMIHRRKKMVLSHDVIDIPADGMPSKVHIFAQLTNYFEEMRKLAKQLMQTKRLIAYSVTRNGFVVKRTKTSSDKLVCSRDELRAYAMDP